MGDTLHVAPTGVKFGAEEGTTGVKFGAEEGTKVPSSAPNFTPVGATIMVQDP